MARACSAPLPRGFKWSTPPPLHTPHLSSSTEFTDFVPFSRDIIFGPNDTNHSVTVEIVDDRVVERSELFVVALTTTDIGVDIERTQREATVVINDDDSMSSHQSVCLSKYT